MAIQSKTWHNAGKKCHSFTSLLSPQCLINCSRGDQSKSLMFPRGGAVVINDQCIANLLTWIHSFVDIVNCCRAHVPHSDIGIKLIRPVLANLLT